MKTFILPILLLLLCYSCKKEGPSFESQLQGKWELRQLYGGGEPSRFYPAGDGQKIEFRASTYAITHWDGSITRGNYQLVDDTDIREYPRRILMDGQSAGYLRIEQCNLIWMTSVQGQKHEVYENIEHK